jgi:hypothetical protein
VQRIYILYFSSAQIPFGAPPPPKKNYFATLLMDYRLEKDVLNLIA